MNKWVYAIALTHLAWIASGGQAAFPPSSDLILAQWRSHQSSRTPALISLEAVADSQTPGFGFHPTPSSEPRRWRLQITPDRLMIEGCRFQVARPDRQLTAYRDSPRQSRLEFRHYLLDQKLNGVHGVPLLASHTAAYPWDAVTLADDFGVLEAALLESACLAVNAEPMLERIALAGEMQLLPNESKNLFLITGEAGTTGGVTVVTESVSPHRVVCVAFHRSDGSEVQVDMRYADAHAEYPEILVGQASERGGGIYAFLTAKMAVSRDAIDSFIVSYDRQLLVLTSYERLRRGAWRLLHYDGAVGLAAASPILLLLAMRWRHKSPLRLILLARPLVFGAVILLALVFVRQTTLLSPTINESYRRLTATHQQQQLADKAGATREDGLHAARRELALCTAELTHQRECWLRWSGAPGSPSAPPDYLALVDLIGLASHDLPRLIDETDQARVIAERLVANRTARLSNHLSGASPYTPPLKAKTWEQAE